MKNIASAFLKVKSWIGDKLSAADMNSQAVGTQSRSISKANFNHFNKFLTKIRLSTKNRHYDRLEPKFEDVRTRTVSIGGASRRASVDLLNKRSM